MHEDLVFFGNAVDVLLRTELFLTGPRDLRLWTLSSSHAKLIELCLSLENGSVGILPRYVFFPPGRKTKRLSLAETVDVVYSGRIVAGKNVHLAVTVANMISSRVDGRVRLHLAYPQADSCLQEVKELAAENTIELIDHGNLGIEWIEKLHLRNPLLVNLSSYACEDFNVAVAQAQAAGWPMLLSQWGAFHDVSGPGVAKISLSALSPIGTDEALIWSLLKQLCDPDSRKIIHRSRPARPLPLTELYEMNQIFQERSVSSGRVNREFLNRLLVLSLGIQND